MFITEKNLYRDLLIYETGSTFMRFLIYVKHKILKSEKGECKVPDSVIDSISRLVLPDIQVFFETEEGLKAYEEWKADKQKSKV